MDLKYEIDMLLAEWRPKLDLDRWEVTVKYNDDNSLASCEAKPQYLAATITFNLVKIAEEGFSRIQLEELVLHELVHCRLWALANVMPDLDNIASRYVEYFEEEATSQMTNALLRAKYPLDKSDMIS